MTTPLILRNAELNAALELADRQYAVGDLQLPQASRFLRSSQLEFGFSRYRGTTRDDPHCHTRSVECLFVVDGEYHVRLLDSGESVVLRSGDFLAMEPDTGWASKATYADVLFVKSPGGPDKKIRTLDAASAKWLATPVPAPPDSEGRLEESALDARIALYSVYMQEWQYRDEIFWKQNFQVFVVALLAGLMPYLGGYFNVELPKGRWLFPTVSLVLSTYFLFIATAYAVRLQAAGESAQRIATQLPAHLRPVRLGELRGWRSNRLFRARIAMWAPVAMFAFLVFMNLAVFLTH